MTLVEGTHTRIKQVNGSAVCLFYQRIQEQNSASNVLFRHQKSNLAMFTFLLAK